MILKLKVKQDTVKEEGKEKISKKKLRHPITTRYIKKGSNDNRNYVTESV